MTAVRGFSERPRPERGARNDRSPAIVVIHGAPGSCVWCAREDSNLHGVIPHKALNLARLPIPPLAQDGAV